MNAFILILTLVIPGYNGYAGGTAMQEFNTQKACLEAGHKWRMLLDTKARKYSTVICAPKGVT